MRWTWVCVSSRKSIGLKFRPIKFQKHKARRALLWFTSAREIEIERERERKRERKRREDVVDVAGSDSGSTRGG